MNKALIIALSSVAAFIIGNGIMTKVMNTHGGNASIGILQIVIALALCVGGVVGLIVALVMWIVKVRVRKV